MRTLIFILQIQFLHREVAKNDNWPQNRKAVNEDVYCINQ